MRIDCSAEELALLQSRRFRPYLRAFVADADGTWQDTSSLQGISHLYDVTADIDIDNKVSSFQLHLRRDAGPTRSLSPFRTDSILNRNADDEFASLLDAGRDVYAQVGVGAPGSTEPLAWHTIAVGTIDAVDLAGAIVVAQCRDQGAVLADTYTPQQDHYLYVDPVTLLGTPAPLQHVIERILQNSNVGLSAIRVLGDPSYVIQNFEVNVEPVLDPVLRLAQLPGWDFRWLWSNTDGKFLPTLYDPEREKVIPDLVLDPSQYIEVKECAIDRTNVRNEILIQFGSAVNRSRRIPRSLSDAQSISRYHRKTLLITEATNGPIKSDAEADAMLGFVLSDLKDPIASLQLVMFPFWPVELHDLVRCTANGQHFNTDVDLAVTKIRHQFGGDKPRTTLFLRGSPAAYYRGWVRRARVPVTPSSDREADVDEYLEDLRVERISASQARVTWTRAEGVAYVFAYAETLAATEAFPAPTETPTILSAGTDELLVALPAPGQRTFVQLEPRDDVGDSIEVLGGVRRLTIDPMGEVVGYTYETAEPFEGTGRVTITLEDSGGFVHTTQKIRFRKTLLGVTTEHAASTAPAGTTTSGTYTFDLLLDAKHPTMVEAFWVDTDGQAHPINSWTFDRDKNANVVNVAVTAEGNTGRITATFDTDTATGADCAGYSLNGTDWTTFAVGSDRTGLATIPLSSAPQTVYVRGKNAAGAWGPAVQVELPVGVVTWTSEATEPAADTGRVTIVLDDGAGLVDPAQRVRFRVLQGGSVVDGAATTAPSVGTSGTYTKDVPLDPKHPILVEAYATLADASILPLGSWTFDRDKNANVLNLTAVVEGNSATVVANFDTDAVVGAGKARYAIDTESGWTTFDIDAARRGTVAIAITSARQAVYVQAQNADGAWGPSASLELPSHAVSLSTSIRLTSTHGIITWAGTNVEARVDSGAWGPPPPDDDGVVAGNQITIARNAPGGAFKHYDFRSMVNGQEHGRTEVVPPMDPVAPVPPLIYGLELAIYSDVSDEIEATFVQQGSIDHIHVVWWVLEYSPGTKTEATANFEVFELTGYDIAPAGSGTDEITVMAYVVGHDASHSVVAVSNVAELRRVPIV